MADEKNDILAEKSFDFSTNFDLNNIAGGLDYMVDPAALDKPESIKTEVKSPLLDNISIGSSVESNKESKPTIVESPKYDDDDLGKLLLDPNISKVKIVFADILNAILGSNSFDVDEMKNLVDSLNVSNILSVQEKEVTEFIISYLMRTTSLPDNDFVKSKFPVFELSKISCSFKNCYYFVSIFKSQRATTLISKSVMEVSSLIKKDGVCKSALEKLRKIYTNMSSLGLENEEDEITFENFDEYYNKKRQKSVGLLTGVSQFDELVGGLHPGSVNTIFGYTGSFKTMFAFNMAYYNAIKLNYNVAYISLEVSKEDLYYNLFSRHSCDIKFSKNPVNRVPHDKIRKCCISANEQEFISSTLIPDLKKSKGNLFILDESSFKEISEIEIETKLLELDKQCSGLDAVFVDHLQLFKFAKDAKSIDVKEVMNKFMSFFRRLSINFRGKKLSVVVLSQVNRDGWNRATKNNGAYDLIAIAEANEIERASYRIFSIYSNDQLKLTKECRMQLLKNRSGRTEAIPLKVFVDPEVYFFGDINLATDGGNSNANDASGFSVPTPNVNAFDDSFGGFGNGAPNLNFV